MINSPNLVRWHENCKDTVAIITALRNSMRLLKMLGYNTEFYLDEYTARTSLYFGQGERRVINIDWFCSV